MRVVDRSELLRAQQHFFLISGAPLNSHNLCLLAHFKFVFLSVRCLVLEKTEQSLLLRSHFRNHLLSTFKLGNDLFAVLVLRDLLNGFLG